MFEVKAEDGKARFGELETSHGRITTPFFMPVATKAAAKYLNNDDLISVGTEAIIVNAFVLYLKPGLEVVEQFGGIHKFMNWDKVIFTDSGGFQMLSKDFLVMVSNKKGIHFRSPYDNKRHIVTPEKAIEIENILNADVAMALDFVPQYKKDYDYNVEAVKKTHVWAERCRKAHDNEKQLLFGITQGGTYDDLRIKSAKFIDSLGFDGVAIGGLCIGETKEDMYRAIDVSLPHISKDKPRYLMGVGSPKDLIESVAHGIDIFDSRFPTQSARHARIFTSKGDIIITKQIYKKDEAPLDEECRCLVCKRFSRAYIHHLFKSDEPNAKHYASMHNLFVVQDTIRKIRKAIDNNDFGELRKIY